MDATERLAKEVFSQLVEEEPAARAALFERLCAANPAVRGRVERLLAAHERADRAFGSGDGAWATEREAARHDLAPGDWLGPYEVLSVAGSGSFGTVWVARQSEPVQRQVALKLLRRGLESAAARTRFDAERQALARMQHPYIARVYDAGTTDDGRPYFVMELVEGLPITRYCDQRGLGLAERLRLLQEVCLAVQHAHQKGVVHRDLKPSNVLVSEVDGRAHPKVIDFGVAKAIDRPLTEIALVSVEGQLIGTPSYMSPEQAAGETDVDTRADVYALGALLYELLTGEPPFDAEELGIAALFHAIAERDPQRPSMRASTTSERVPTDLDWIVMRCLEKERARRYPSAAALADDLARFARGLPVEAAPPSRWYRLRKLGSRHRVALASAALVLVALAGGIVGTTVGLYRAKVANVRLAAAVTRAQEEAEHAREAELRATAQWEVAEAVNRFVTDDLLSAAAPSAEAGRGLDATLREVLDAASSTIESAGEPGGRFGTQPLVEASIRSALGTIYDLLGERRVAEHHLRRAHALRASALGPEDRDTLSVLSELGDVLARSPDTDEANRLLEEAHEAQARVLGDEDADTLRTKMHLGMLRYREGSMAEAYGLLSEARAVAEEALGPDEGQTIALLNALAISATASGHDAEAEAAFRESLRRRRAHSGDEHPAVVDALTNLGAFLRSVGRYEEAAPFVEAAHERHVTLRGMGHPATLTSLYNLAGLERERGRLDEAEEFYREAVAGYEALKGAASPDTLAAVAGLATVLEERGERGEAEELYVRAYEGTLRALGHDHPTTDSRRKDLASFLSDDPERREEAFALVQESVTALRQRLGTEHPSTLRALSNLAWVQRERGSLDEAEALLGQVAEGFRALHGPEHVDTLLSETDLADLYLELGRPVEAEALARRTVEIGERTLPASSKDLARFRIRLGRALAALGREDEARRELEAVVTRRGATHGAEDATVAAARSLLEELARPKE